MQIWVVLVGAAHNRQTLTYKELGSRLGLRAQGVFAQSLDKIMRYCVRNGLPPLTCLVVNQKTGLPGEGLSAVINLPRDRERVYQVNWYARRQPQPADFI